MSSPGNINTLTPFLILDRLGAPTASYQTAEWTLRLPRFYF